MTDGAESNPLTGPDYAKVLKDYGALGVIAIFLVWLMASGLTTDVRDLKAALSGHVSETNYYLRAICNNTAQSEGQRANCITPERR